MVKGKPRKAHSKCPLCKSPLNEADAVASGNSMAGDALADHLLDYHQSTLNAGEDYGLAVINARTKAKELRRDEERAEREKNPPPGRAAAHDDTQR